MRNFTSRTALLRCCLISFLFFGCDASNDMNTTRDGGTGNDLSMPTMTTTVDVGIPDTISYEHPSLYLTADRRDFILRHIQTEPMATIYASIEATAASDFDDIDLDDWDAKAHGNNGEIASANAFLAWLNDDETAANRAINAMALLNDDWDKHEGWGINIRMQSPLIHYTAAWDLMKATPYFSEAEAQLAEEKLTNITTQFYDKYVLDEFTRNLSLLPTQNNHGIRTAAAIGFVALAFPNHPNAPAWMDWATSELDYLMGPAGQYVQSDGAISEGPFYFSFGFAPTIPFYIALHNRGLSGETFYRNCATRSDVDPWTNHGCEDGTAFVFTNPIQSERLRDTLDWSLSLRLPNGNRAPIADSPLRNQAGQAIVTRFGGAEYLYWDWISNGDQPHVIKGGFELGISHLAYVEPIENSQPPTWKTRFFVDGGMANFRSGWGLDDRVLILLGQNESARKTVHDHTDGTAFVMAAYGELLLMDTGYYKPNSLANATTSGAGSHNLILIDGKGAPEKGLLTNWGDADAFIENTRNGDSLNYAESRQRYQDTDVVRGVTFVRSRYFIVADRLHTDVMAERQYLFRLHAYAGKDLDGTVTLNAYGPHIERPLGSTTVFTSTTAGPCHLQEPPYVMLEPPHVHKLTGNAADHTVTDCEITGMAPDFLTVLAPYKSGVATGADAPLNVIPLETENGAAWMIEGADFVDVAWLREEGAANTLQTPSGHVIETDGKFVLLSLDGTIALLNRGTRLKLDNDIVLSAQDSISLKQE